jgi:hypothetical protein
MMAIARVARRPLSQPPRGVRDLAPWRSVRPAAGHARAGAAPRSAGTDGRRACAGGGGDHAHGGDGESTRGRSGRGGGGGGRPGRVVVLQGRTVVIDNDQVDEVLDGGDRWEVPPAVGSGGGREQRRREGRWRDGGGESRGGERKSKKREGAAGEAG